MKPIQLLRQTPHLRSALHRTLTTASRTRPPNPPSPLLNLPKTTCRHLTSHFPRLPRKPPTTSTHTPKRLYTTPPKRLYTTTPPNLPIPPPPPPTSLSLSQRLRKLSREYGWSAFGVYMLLSALDFPFCFAAVRYLGTDRIGRWEHAVVEWVKHAVPEGVREAWREWMRAGEEVGKVEEGYAVVRGGEEVGGGVAGYDDHGVQEAERRNRREDASIWTQLALAYAIHKSFIFIRVPLAVAVTPKVVKVLRGWGWDIGKRRPKGVK